MSPTFCVTSRSFFRATLAIIAFLVAASTFGQISKFVFDHGQLHGLVRLFYLDGEGTVPSFFSALQLFVAAVLLGLIARSTQARGGRYLWHWWILALGFVFLALDESCSIHETMQSHALESTLHVEKAGYFFFSWVIPAMFLVTLAGLFFLPFLWQLPTETRWQFILGAVLFLGGAVGVEMFEAHYAAERGFNNLGYVAYVTCEESLEMLGITVFIRALLRYIEQQFGFIGFRLGASCRQVPAEPNELPVSPSSSSDRR